MRPHATGFARVEGIDACGLFGIQREGEHVEVGGHALAAQGLGEDNVAAIQRPTQRDLSRAHAEVRADLDERRVGDGASAREGRPGLEHHAEALGVGAQGGVGEEGVGLDLEDVRGNGRDRPDGLDVLALVVRQADRACAAGVECVLEGGPGQGDVAPVERGQRPVHEEEVDVVGAQVLEGALDGCGGPLGLVVGVVDLRRDEQVPARDSRGFERGPDLGLVAVHLSGVDMAVPDFEGAAHRIVRVLGRDLVGAETENGDGRSRRKHKGRTRGRGRGGACGKRGVHR